MAGSAAVTARPGAGSAGAGSAEAARREALAGSTAVTAHPGSGSAGTGSARAASLEALAGSTAVTARPGSGSAGTVPARAAGPEALAGPTGSPDNPGATPRTSNGGTGLDGTRTVLPAGVSGGATASAHSTAAGTASPQGRPASAPSVPAGTAAGRPATASAHQASAGTATASAGPVSTGEATTAGPPATPAGTATAPNPPASPGTVTPSAHPTPAGTATAPNPPASLDTAAAPAHARPTRSALSPKVEPVVVRSGAALVVPAGASAAAAVGAPDFRRITAARVGAVAVPVAAVVRVARRKNVIGAETTGSIPVHLLFRDEPDTAAAPLAAGEDDGGPDTVAMAVPTPPPPSRRAPKGRGPAIPAPQTTSPGRKKSRQQSVAGKAAASRPVPSADPALVERPGPVLPGWVGAAGGVLALAGCAAVVWWAGAVPEEAARMLRLPERPYHGIHLGQWALLALGVLLTLFAVGGLGRGRVGYAWVLTLFGDYRGTVRRTGLVWVSPLLLRRRVDVRLRHWRSEPLSAVDAKGTALDVVVLVVWRVRDTVRAALGVDGHEEYLREQVEAAMARVLSQLPADAFHEDAPTLRDAEAVGEALTRMLSAECAPVGVDVFSAQPTRIEYAPEVAAAMTRRRIAAIDAKHRDSVLTSVVDAVDDVVHRLTSRGLVELDDYERKALVKDLTVAFYTGRTGPVEGA
ncbi:membrane protease subunit [Streptomyces venezuelae]|nr:membrane protease subunit [Streptomyces venezuelae]